MLVTKGLVIQRLGELQEEQDVDPINSFALSPDNVHTVSHHKSGLFRLWNWRGKNFDARAHEALCFIVVVNKKIIIVRLIINQSIIINS